MSLTEPPIPESSLLSGEVRAALRRARMLQDLIAVLNEYPLSDTADRAEATAIRRQHAEAFYATPSYKKLRDCYEVAISLEESNGIPVEIFTPVSGIAPENARRVLINLHGGGLMVGSRLISHIECAPIAALGKIRVVSVDYRMAPEHNFPAASDDVVAVYRELIGRYDPKSIGIFGCSGGGFLTAQVVARLQKDSLPLPAAVGMFCAAGNFWAEGDSAYLAAPFTAAPLGTFQQHPYFRGVKSDDPLAFPARSDAVMAKFPPSLLIASTRDFGLSSVVQTHSVLTRQSVDASLHVWEGLGHGFFYDTDLPQSREVHEVTVRFFNRHLAQ